MSDADQTDARAMNTPQRKSWVISANAPESDFPIQNLPFGIFSLQRSPVEQGGGLGNGVEDRMGGGIANDHGTAPRVGVAIGDAILDLSVLAEEGLLQQDPRIFAQPSLNSFIALGQTQWRDVRVRLTALLDIGNPELRDNLALQKNALVAQAEARMHLPVDIPGYTDFYSSKEHATNVGSLFRDPKHALLPNWLEMPIGYNGRASSVVVSGTPVRRPNGQIKLPDAERPIFGPCRKLDIELETGFIVGKNTTLGDPIACEEAESHIFGMVLLNDWSARDIQQWEYVPLGPFNSKGFTTSISPWVVTLDALAPFRCAQPVQSPEPLPYLRHTGRHGFDIQLEVDLLAADEHGTRAIAHTLTRTNFKYMYWTMAQQLAHHTSSGCNVRIGDLMGSGTISGPTPESCGSLLELTSNGQRPLTLPSGQQRTFIADGDELVLRGWCQGEGYRVGFGTCSGRILPAVSSL
jgi:fumarylacetoacetase